MLFAIKRLRAISRRELTQSGARANPHGQFALRRLDSRSFGQYFTRRPASNRRLLRSLSAIPGNRAVYARGAGYV